MSRPRTPLRIGLLGNGAIARLLARFCTARPDRLCVVGAVGLPTDVVSVGHHPVVPSWSDLLAMKPELIVECAGHGAVQSHACAVLAAGIDLIIVSTGSLADEELWQQIRAATERSSARVKLPSGSLPCVDTLSAAKLAGLSRVTLQSSKPPRAWRGTPAERTHNLEAISAPTVIFSGNAREAALAFPKNANVAATAALAGVGFEATAVTLIADPRATQNIHRLEAEGAFGRVTSEINANPSPDNPKTSHMAALSIMRLIENETAGIII